MNPGDKVIVKRTEKNSYPLKSGEYVKSETDYFTQGTILKIKNDRARVQIRCGALVTTKLVLIKDIQLSA